MTKCNKCGEWWTPQCPVCFSRDLASGSSSATLLEVPNCDFKKLVAEMSESELRVRVLNQWSFIAAYAKSLDGLNLRTPGSIDGHRMPDDIRRAVETLIGTSNAALTDPAAKPKETL